MKKATIILLSLLMVLAVGQAAFAKGNVGLTVGYEGFVFETDNKNGFETWYNCMKINLNGNYYFTEKISLSAMISTDIAFSYDGDKSYRFTQLGFNLFGRYDIFNWDTASIGLQLGISDSLLLENENTNYFYLTLGTYANVYVMPKCNLYADVKFPIGAFSHLNNTGFFKTVLYDITLGAIYDIYPNINIGIEGNVSNVNACSNNDMFGEGYYKDFTFSIGAKVGYSF